MHKKIILALSLLVAILTVITHFKSSAQTDTLPTTKPARLRDWNLEQTYQVTSVQEGVMTPQQAEHGRLYSGGVCNDGEQKLRDKPGTGGVVAFDEGDAVQPETPTVFDLNAHLTALGNAASAVVLVSPLSGTSQLTQCGDSVFTDYTASVERIFKNNSAAPILAGANITVTRQGGAVSLNGRTFRVASRNFFPFQIGRRYLLYLNHVPSTGAYQAVNTGSFWLVNGKVTELGPGLPTSATDSEATFLDAVCSALGGACAGPTPPRCDLSQASACLKGNGTWDGESCSCQENPCLDYWWHCNAY